MRLAEISPPHFARETLPMGTGQVFLPADILGILFRGSQSPGSPDREHEICLDSPENQANRKPPLLIHRRILGAPRWMSDNSWPNINPTGPAPALNITEGHTTCPEYSPRTPYHRGCPSLTPFSNHGALLCPLSVTMALYPVLLQ